MENDDYFTEEGFSPIKSLLGLLTFSTILPINVFTSIEYMTRLTWCWPFLHLIIGVLAAVCGLICGGFLHLNTFLTSNTIQLPGLMLTSVLFHCFNDVLLKIKEKKYQIL